MGLELIIQKNLFGMEHLKTSRPKTMPSKHFHNYYELFYLLSGERVYFINDRTYNIKSGDLVLINPLVLHRTVSSGTQIYERILIYFKREFIEQIGLSLSGVNLLDCFGVNLLRLKNKDKTEAEIIILKMMREYQALSKSSLSYLKVLLAELLIILGNIQKNNPDEPYDHPSYMHEKISDVIRFINSNYMFSISLEDVAKRFYLSRFHLSRTFKSVIGMPFTQYINSVRINESQNLLRSTRQKVSEIAQSVGFDNQSHFGRVFKKMTGMSPLNYRRASE